MTEEVFIHNTAEVYFSAHVDKGSKVWHQAQVREEAIVGENCTLCKGVYIDKKVKVGNRVKVENYACLYQGVTIEDDVFIGPHTTFTNDLYPRASKLEWKIIPTLVKKGASIGANSTIVCGITIGEHAMIGAGSIVTHDVPDHGLVIGNPALLKGFVCHCGHPLKYQGKERELARMSCPSCENTVDIPVDNYNKLEQK